MNPKLITYKKISDSIYWAVFQNNAVFGEIYKEVDGYFYFQPNNKLTGCVPAHILREVADKMDELNKSWNEQIDDYFDKKS